MRAQCSAVFGARGVHPQGSQEGVFRMHSARTVEGPSCAAHLIRAQEDCGRVVEMVEVAGKCGRGWRVWDLIAIDSKKAKEKSGVWWHIHHPPFPPAKGRVLIEAGLGGM